MTIGEKSEVQKLWWFQWLNFSIQRVFIFNIKIRSHVFRITANIISENSIVVFFLLWAASGGSTHPGHCWLLWIWGRLIGIDRFWCRSNDHFSQDLMERHKNKPDQISPRQSASSLPHTYTLCWLAAIKQHLPSTHPNALIYWSLTGWLQQLQVALQANAATVIDTATIRRFNTASIPEKPWLRVLWRKIKVHKSLCWSLNTICYINIRQHHVAKTDFKNCKNTKILKGYN